MLAIDPAFTVKSRWEDRLSPVELLHLRRLIKCLIRNRSTAMRRIQHNFKPFPNQPYSVFLFPLKPNKELL